MVISVSLRRLLRGTVQQVRNSSHQPVRQKTLSDIYKIYNKNEKISVITAHDYITAKWANDAKNVDVVLIGDSLANTAKGLTTTMELDFMDYYYTCKSVIRGIDSKFIIADLPFGSFESSEEKCVETSMKLMKLGKIGSVKLEGCFEYSNYIERLISVGIPVTSHIGLKPQRYNAMGGYKIQGRTFDSALEIFKEAKHLESLGVSMIVLECIPHKLAKFMTENLNIPTIGIGAGSHTSGQVLVQSDLFNMLDNKLPKFVKNYQNYYESSVSSLESYGKDLKTGQFPDDSTNAFEINEEEFNEFTKAAKDVK